MEKFYFGIDTIDIICEALSEANEFVKIAIFQIHSQKVFNILNSKAIQGLNVEIITLPNDSIHADVQEEVINRFNHLISLGAKIFHIPWNVGDPSRTTTAVGRWYSFHGKFIVTDKNAIALSANFTAQDELDAVIISDEVSTINQFISKFEWLKRTFVLPHGTYQGSIRQDIISTFPQGTSENDIEKIFKLPSTVNSQTHKNTWIKEYPEKMIPIIDRVRSGLYIMPFDGKARDLYEKIIENAQEFVYLSSESFTDFAFALFIKKIKTSKNLDIKVLTGAQSQDFSDRIKEMYLELVAYQVQIRTTNEPIHGKLMITDHGVVISSVNLNKINLGFPVRKNFWRGNTETLYLGNSDDIELIQDAKEKYQTVFSNALDIFDKFTDKMYPVSGNIFSKVYNLKSEKRAKILLSRIILYEKIEAQRIIVKMGSYVTRLVRLFHPENNIVKADDLIAAMILFFLSESKLSENQLKQKLENVSHQIDPKNSLRLLLQHRLVEIDMQGYFKIDLERLIGRDYDG